MMLAGKHVAESNTQVEKATQLAKPGVLLAVHVFDLGIRLGPVVRYFQHWTMEELTRDKQ